MASVEAQRLASRRAVCEAVLTEDRVTLLVLEPERQPRPSVRLPHQVDYPEFLLVSRLGRSSSVLGQVMLDVFRRLVISIRDGDFRRPRIPELPPPDPADLERGPHLGVLVCGWAVPDLRWPEGVDEFTVPHAGDEIRAMGRVLEGV